MPTSIDKYLDPAGLDETVLNIRQLTEVLEAEMQGLPYARPDGLYPDMTVGAVIGADSTAQWAQRVSTGTGSATVRSVQGAAVAWNQLVGSDTSSVTVPSGHKYLGIIGGASAIATSDGTAVSVTGGTDQLFDLTQMFGSGNEPSTVAEFEQMYPESYYPYSAPTLKPVQIAGIASTTAQGGELDSVEWTAQTLWGAGTAGDMLYADRKETHIGVVDLGTLTWIYSTNTQRMSSTNLVNLAVYPSVATVAANIRCLPYGTASDVDTIQHARDKLCSFSTTGALSVYDTAYTDAAAFKAAMSGVLLFYELATPTTTPISPALPMSYKVQQGGSEAIIVPDGEVSAVPVLTIAEPVNMSTELARIWAAIQSLGYTRNATQLSRPVSLTDTVSMDETQKDTAEIDTTKEVTE